MDEVVVVGVAGDGDVSRVVLYWGIQLSIRPVCSRWMRGFVFVIGR